jgi:hypothetical protein
MISNLPQVFAAARLDGFDVQAGELSGGGHGRLAVQ